MPNSYFYANDLSNFFTVYLNQAHLVNYVEILLSYSILYEKYLIILMPKSVAKANFS